MEKEYKYHYLYKTICTVTKKEYIGVHSTDTIEDGYLGSGYLLTEDIKKYGKEYFLREIIAFFDDRETLLKKERELVDENYIGRVDTYNLVKGGNGNVYISEETIAKRLKTLQKSYKRFPELLEKNRKNALLGAKLSKTPEARAKQKKTLQERGHQKGEKNSQYGTRWYNDGFKNVKIPAGVVPAPNLIKGRLP